MKQKKPVIALILLLVAGLFFYYFATRTPFSEQRPAVGEMAPEIALADLSGKMVGLSKLKGQVVLVNFWAGWCPPCIDELTVFQKLFDAYEERGFAVIALALDDISPSLIVKEGLTFSVAKTNERVRRAYGDIGNVPVSFLIGRDGRIIKKIRKVYPEGILRSDVEKALKAEGQGDEDRPRNLP